MKKILISTMLLLICISASISVLADETNITLFENSEYTTTIFYQNENNTEIITSATALAQNSSVIISLYRDYKLVNLRIFTYNETSNTFTMSESNEFDTVKIFVWNNINTLKPQCSIHMKNELCKNSSNEKEHIIMIDEFITIPTCTEDGILGTRHCIECGKIFNDEKAISALGHSEITDSEILPTCTNIGFTEGSHCERCDEVLKAQFSIPAIGHNSSEDANCQHAQTCLNCGIILAEKTEHNYINFVCSVCQQRNTTPTEGLAYQKYKDSNGNFFYRVKGVGTATSKDIVIPSSYEGVPVTGMDYPCFYGNTNITSVWLPDSIEYIGLSVFRECSNLEYVNIPSSVNCIEGAAFEDCYNLKSEIIIPEGVTTIENSTFCNCYDLESIVLPSSLKIIESSAFYNCFKLKSVDLPEGLENIGNRAFKATDIETLRIPSTVQTIGESVFYLCDKLKTLYLSNNSSFVQNFDDIFKDCSSITNVFYDGTCLEWKSNGGSDTYNVVCEKSSKTTDHYVVATHAIEPTCTETGLTEGAHCDVCDKIIVKQTVVAANGHTHVDGICTICGDNIRDFSGGNGTEEMPYLISKADDLDNVREFPTANFKMISDVEFETSDFEENGAFYNEGKKWIPISDFSGVFDGNNYVITNISINSGSWSGFFGVNLGTIKNTNVINITSVSGATGSVCDSFAGGLTIRNEGIIENCTVDGIIKASSYSEKYRVFSYAGGITVTNKGVINKCINYADVSAYSKVGAYSTYQTSGYAGGIAATSGTDDSASNVIIKNCYNNGTIYVNSGANHYSNNYYAVVGGIVGNSYDSGQLEHCYNIGVVDYDYTYGYYGSNMKMYTYIGGISNHLSYYSCSPIECYYYGNGKANGSTQCTLEEMRKKETFVGFDFENVWTIDSTSDYPYPVLR